MIQRLLDALGRKVRSRAAIVHHAYVGLVFRRLRQDHTPTADEIEHAMRVIDSGQLDAMMQHAVPPSQPAEPAEPAEPERYANVKPFDHEEWKERHARK